MKRAAAALVAGLAFAGATTALAHDVRPAYLELREVDPGRFEVLFKTQRRGSMSLGLQVSFSARNEATPIVPHRTSDALVETWTLRAPEGLAGQQIRIDGLDTTLSDALVRIVWAGGESWMHHLAPGAPSVTVPVPQSGSSVARTYLVLGVEHILTGIDHLLFLLALALIAPSVREVIQAVTAFTAAHSLTLAAATLGFVRVPPAPVEALIALSIAFVALEIVRAGKGSAGLAARSPWIVAFAFGLLHGLGFAGALSEIGLPPGHIPLALLFFNVGVEVGQLPFVAAVLAAGALLARTGADRLPPWVRFVPPYFIGSLATFWVFERVAAFWRGG